MEKNDMSALVAAAAGELDSTEGEVFLRAYKHWYGRVDGEAIAAAYRSYTTSVMNGEEPELPVYVRHYCRDHLGVSGEQIDWRDLIPKCLQR